MIVSMNVSYFVKNLSGINDFTPTYLYGCRLFWDTMFILMLVVSSIPESQIMQKH